VRKKSRRNRRTALLLVLAFAGLIGILSWHDLRAPSTPAKKTAGVVGYYVAQDLDPTRLPDDGLPLLILQGVFRYPAPGVTEFKVAGIAPVTLAQRQAGLLFRLESLPESTAITFGQIDDRTEEWKNKGTSIAEIMIDARGVQVNSKQLNALLEGLRQSPSGTPRIVNILVSGDRGVRAPLVLLDTPDLKTAQALGARRQSFQVLLPANGALDSRDAWDALAEGGFFEGFVQPLDFQNEKGNE